MVLFFEEFSRFVLVASLCSLGMMNSSSFVQVGDEIEVRPGIVTKDKSGRVRCIPIFSRIVSLHAEQNDLQFAAPGEFLSPVLAVVLSVCLLACCRWLSVNALSEALHC